jgi:tetratricopeptide (TPR) repeat protein
MLEIYRDIYSGRHQFIGIALSNLAGVHLERGDPRRAEALFEEALQLYAELLDPNHPLIGIARVRAGNAAARQGRWRVAESHILAGLEILAKQSSPPPRWVEMGNSDLERLRRALAEEESSAANAREKQIAELDSPPDTDLE